jgi:hypothetical protein
MHVDSSNTVSQFKIWSYSWLNPSTIVAIIAFAFTLYKYLKIRTITKPTFTYFSHIYDSEGDHFVIKISSGFSGSIPKPVFYARRIYFGFIPFRKLSLHADFIDNLEDLSRFDSEIPKTIFKDEGSFWVFVKNGKFPSKGKYRVYVKSTVGKNWITYRPRLGKIINKLIN